MIRMSVRQQNQLNPDVLLLRELQHVRGSRASIEPNALAGFWVPNQIRIHRDVPVRRVETSQSSNIARIIWIPRLLPRRDQCLCAEVQNWREFSRNGFF